MIAVITFQVHKFAVSDGELSKAELEITVSMDDWLVPSWLLVGHAALVFVLISAPNVSVHLWRMCHLEWPPCDTSLLPQHNLLAAHLGRFRT